jgi:hypothetical protein
MTIITRQFLGKITPRASALFRIIGSGPSFSQIGRLGLALPPIPRYSPYKLPMNKCHPK